MIFKIFVLLVIVGVIFGWDKVLNLFKAIFQVRREFEKGLKEGEENKREKKPDIKVVK